jgi:type II secretory pathway component GspD/PulD (secretin)
MFQDLKARRSLSLALCIGLLGSLIGPAALAQQIQEVPHLTGDVSVRVAPNHLNETFPIPGASRRVTMSFHGVSIADALRALGRQGGFNVLVDSSVQGDLSVDLKNVRIQDALETFRNSGKLAYSVQGGNLVAAAADSPRGQSFNKATTRIFPLKNANAVVLANFFNQSIFADRNPTGGSSGGGGGLGALSGGSGGGSGTGNTATPGLTVTPDPQTNSLIVVGTPSDINTVDKHLKDLDLPREMRTWRLSHANVLDVATIISSSLFNEGQPSLLFSSGSSSSSSGGGQTPGGLPSTLRVTSENLSDGNGSNQLSQGSSGGGGGSSGGSSSGGSSGGTTGSVMSSNITLRAKIKQSQTVQVSPKNAILIPDTRLNTLTLLGTAEQIAAVEAFLPTLDRKVPQVLLETSLIEISDTGRRELGFSQGATSGTFSSGANNLPIASSGALVNTPYTNAIGVPNSVQSPLESVFGFSSNPATRRNNFVYQLNALVSKNKAKLLANPSAISTSDTETMISIVDEIIKSVTVTVPNLGGSTTATDNIGEAGIILNILPRVGADGTINLRVRPIVSTVSNTQLDRFGNLITLVSKREALAQNSILHDGETFVLGGLIQDTNNKAVTSSPLLSSLPILGALARNSISRKGRTELVLLVTPHIIADEKAPPIQTSSARHVPDNTSMASGAMSNGGIIPVSLTPLNQPVPMNALPPLMGTQVMYSSQQLQRSSAVDAPLGLRGEASPLPGREPVSQANPASASGGASNEDIRAIMNKFR